LKKRNERLLQKTIENIIAVIVGKKIITKAKSGLSLKQYLIIYLNFRL